MRDASFARWASAGLFMAVVLGGAAPAQALTCVGPGGIVPPGGVAMAADTQRVMPPDGLIVTLCPTESVSAYCQPPILGHTLEEDLLIRTDDRLLLGDGSLDRDGNPRLRVLRFRALQPLVVGDTYQFALRDVDGSVASKSSSVVVVEAASTPPPLPVVTDLSYLQTFGFSQAIRLAFFRLEHVSGLLVADVGEPDEDPWRNISPRFSEHSEHGFYFRLGVDECDANFRQADLGVETTVRFGQLDAAGRFSGWTSQYLVSYPAADNEGTPIPGTVIALNAEAGEPEVPEGVSSAVPEGAGTISSDEVADPGDEVVTVDDDLTPPSSTISSSTAGCSLSAAGSATSSSSWLFALCALYASRWLSSAASGSTSSRSKRSSVAREPG
jgi:hypothetical protein